MGMTSLKNKFLRQLVMIDIAVCYLSCCGFLRLHFSNDGYSRIYDGSKSYITTMSNGRYAGALAKWIMKRIGFYDTAWAETNFVFTVLFICACGICAACLTREVMLYRENAGKADVLMLNIGVLLTFVNAFIAEWYTFCESMYYYTPAILGACMAAISLHRAYRTGKKRLYALSLILLLLSYNSYQIAIGIFVFWIMLFIWLQSNAFSDRGWLKNTFCAVCMTLIVVISNLCVTKILLGLGVLTQSRYTEINRDKLLERLEELLNAQATVWIKANNQLPEGMFLCNILLLLAFLVIFLMQRKSFQDALKALFGAALVLLGGLGAVFAPHLITGVWLANRSCVALFCIFGVLTAMCFVLCPQPKPSVVLSVILALFFAFNVYSFQNTAQEQVATNATDEEISLQIGYAIEQYETASGIQVRNVGFVNDTAVTYYYPFSEQKFKEQATRAWPVSWNRLPCLNYYLGRDFVSVTVPDDIYDTYFEGKNWDRFVPEEQLVFDGDCLYIAVY